MAMIVRAFPVLPGKEEELRKMAKTMGGEHAAEGGRFYTGLGVRHESWYLQQTTAGLMVLVVTDIDVREERAEQYAQSRADFHRWFKTKVRELTGIDPDVEPLGPPTEQIFAWPVRTSMGGQT